MKLKDDRKTLNLYTKMVDDVFTEDDWMVTVRLFGIDDKEKFICDQLNRLNRKVYPNRKFREGNECCINTFATIGWTNEEGENHCAAHILIKDFDYRSPTVSSFQQLIYKVFIKNRKMPGDVVVRRIFNSFGASEYIINKQGDDVTIVNGAIRLGFRQTS